MQKVNIIPRDFFPPIAAGWRTIRYWCNDESHLPIHVVADSTEVHVVTLKSVRWAFKDGQRIVTVFSGVCETCKTLHMYSPSASPGELNRIRKNMESSKGE